MAKKASSKSKPSTAGITIKGSGGLLERINTIVAMVNTHLSKYRDDYIIIREEKELEDYITKCIENKIVAIDTETSDLNIFKAVLAGVCLYTPGQKGAYVPIHHVSYVTGVEIDNQISEEFMAQQLQRIKDAEIDIDMFNAKYDIRTIGQKLGVWLKCTWDGYLAARLLNENEQENNLKYLHKKYCLKGQGDAFTFDSLFRGIPFTHIPLSSGYLYAARDPHITYELCEFQRAFLTPGTPECKSQDLEGVAWVFHNIEMPLIPVVCEMEETGIAFDMDYAEELSVKYNKIMEEKTARFYDVCKMYQVEIDNYRRSMGSACKLNDPINIGSPNQIAILLYDILGIKPVDDKKPRGTGEEILSKIDHPVTEAILDYREVSKLLSTYIDKMPAIVNEKTGRIHAGFNQIGADTGRMSSNDPNMQNIPSKNTDIRKMFVASPGYLLFSSDYSAQEPRLTAHMSKDEKMINAYRQGKDLYVEIASIAFNLPYDECQEQRADGTKNNEGKLRRNHAKAIVLGVCYGKGVPAIADDLGIPVKKAQEIYDKIMTAFPGLPAFMLESETMAREKGYVTTAWGRKRRLPDMQLPLYEFKYAGGPRKDFDPLSFEEVEFSDEVDDATINRYWKMLTKCRSRKDKESVRAKAKEEGIIIKDNGGFIAEATRQCVNSRIQGSAADQTKLAMLEVAKDEKLKSLGFRLLLPVHDELIGEGPEEHKDEIERLFSDAMVRAASILAVPSKCDVEVTRQWYGEPIH